MYSELSWDTSSLHIVHIQWNPNLLRSIESACSTGRDSFQKVYSTIKGLTVEMIQCDQYNMMTVTSSFTYTNSSSAQLSRTLAPGHLL